MSKFSHGTCAICKERNDFLMALHGEKGGPMCCLLCSGKWHAEYGKRRRLGRIVIRAMIAFKEGGGTSGDLEKLKDTAVLGTTGFGFDAFSDPLGYLAGVANTRDEVIELTSEVLDNAIKLAHPDCHPPERQELATRVSQQLIALKPFVFSAPIPKPPPEYSGNGKAVTPREPAAKLSRYPCVDCASTIPAFYCSTCRTEWERLRDIKREQEQKEHRRQIERRRKRRKERRELHLDNCVVCGGCFNGKRRDTKFCSAACRQKAHRDPSQITGSRRARRPSIRHVRYSVVIRDDKLFIGEDELRASDYVGLEVKNGHEVYVCGEPFRLRQFPRVFRTVTVSGRKEHLHLLMCHDCKGFFAYPWFAELCDSCAKKRKDEAAAKARTKRQSVTDTRPAASGAPDNCDAGSPP